MSMNGKKLFALIMAQSRLMDYFIGQILEKAKECSGGRPTIVIFTSDHGEMLGKSWKI